MKSSRVGIANLGNSCLKREKEKRKRKKKKKTTKSKKKRKKGKKKREKKGGLWRPERHSHWLHEDQCNLVIIILLNRDSLRN